MTSTVKNLLQSFETLPDSDKRELVAEIVRRSLSLDLPGLTDDDLCQSADELFRELDRREGQDADSSSG